MKTIHRYILIEFAKLLSICASALVMVFLIVDVFENIDDLMKEGAGLWDGAAYFALKVPFVLVQVSPVAALLASLLAVGMLSKHNEATALRAAGVRLLWALAPLFVAGAVLSAGIFFLSEETAPMGLKRADALRRGWSGKAAGSFGREGLWLKTKTGIVNARQADLRKGELLGLTVYETDMDFALKGSVHARLAVWKDGAWVAPSAVSWRFTEGGLATASDEKDLVIEGFAAPEDLSGVADLQRNLTIAELRRYTESLEAEGYDSARHRTDLYSRISFPFVNFIMVLVGIPFALKTGRHAGLAVGVGLSVAIAFGYWVVAAIAATLGRGALLPPIVAAAFPNVLFLAGGALLYGYVRE
jgi:lipopolysaccharide export system permease protein